MKKLIYVSLGLNFICLLGIVYMVAQPADKKKMAFFLSSEVYNNFTYKMELEEELESTYESNLAQLDSLEADLDFTIEFLKSKSEKPSDEQLFALEKKQHNYIDTKDRVEQEYSEKAQKYYTLIWERINQYVSEYGKENDFVYIFGANGDGSLMYADEAEDITQDIVAYVNHKYEGV